MVRLTQREVEDAILDAARKKGGEEMAQLRRIAFWGQPQGVTSNKGETLLVIQSAEVA